MPLPTVTDVQLPLLSYETGIDECNFYRAALACNAPGYARQLVLGIVGVGIGYAVKRFCEPILVMIIRVANAVTGAVGVIPHLAGLRQTAS